MEKVRDRWFVLAVVLLVTACGQTDDRRPDHTPLPTVDDSAPLLHFGVISRYNPGIMYKSYQPMMDYLSARTPYRFELKLGTKYEDAVNFLRDREVAIASLGGLTYLEAHAEFGARPLVRPLNQYGEGFYRSVFVVREESALRKLADLRGHSLALASIHSTSGNLIPRLELARAGVQMQELAAYENLRHHELVAKAVLQGRFDAGAVKDVVATRYRRKGLRFLHRSVPIPSVPLVIRADLPDSVWQPVAQALLALDPAEAGDRQLMQSWDEEFRHGFIPATDADYSDLREKVNRAPEGCGLGCHPKVSF